MTTPLSILTRDRALLGIAGSSTEYITECAEVSRGVSCWRCPSVLLPTAGCWMNAVDAVGLIQISTGAAAQRVRQWTHPPRTSLFRAGCSVWTERSLIDCWRITCPSTPRRLINLNIYSRKSSSNSLHKKYWLFFNLIHERIMESARQRFEWLQYRHLTLSLKISVHVRRPFSAAFSDLTLLGSRKGIRSVKNWVVVICLQRGADLHMAHLMPLPLTVCCFSKIQIGFTFRVPAHPGSPGQRAVKRVCVCVCCS